METQVDNCCSFIDCNENKLQGWKYCRFHNSGGALGAGDTYEQYQIIEQDFIDFIKVVPINDENHMTVHSAVLRDILIRTCVQIELFLKEWSLFLISENSNHHLLNKYNEEYKKGDNIGQRKKERNWNFGDFHCIKKDLSDYYSVFVRPLNENISPFASWENEKTPPFWWDAYNSIKHNGLKAYKDANVKNTLYALAALFQLHCSNKHSKGYLENFTSHQLTCFVDQVSVQPSDITSPIDSKKYLFKYSSGNSLRRKIELVSQKQFANRNTKSRL